MLGQPQRDTAPSTIRLAAAIDPPGLPSHSRTQCHLTESTGLSPAHQKVGKSSRHWPYSGAGRQQPQDTMGSNTAQQCAETSFETYCAPQPAYQGSISGAESARVSSPLTRGRLAPRTKRLWRKGDQGGGSVGSLTRCHFRRDAESPGLGADPPEHSHKGVVRKEGPCSWGPGRSRVRRSRQVCQVPWTAEACFAQR